MNENTEIKMRARRGDFSWADRIELFVCQISENGTHHLGELVFTKQIERYEPTKPTIITDTAHAQILMDDLWDAGIRPTEAKGSAGAMAAVQKHLGDMRKIAFHELKIQGEQI